MPFRGDRTCSALLMPIRLILRSLLKRLSCLGDEINGDLFGWLSVQTMMSMTNYSFMEYLLDDAV